MTQKTIRTIIVCLAMMQSMMTAAQLNDPREKFSITATVDGATNTDYHWDSNDGELLENGRLKQGINARLKASVKLLGSQRFNLSFNPFYNFSTRNMKAELLLSCAMPLVWRLQLTRRTFVQTRKTCPRRQRSVSWQSVSDCLPNFRQPSRCH